MDRVCSTNGTAATRGTFQSESETRISRQSGSEPETTFQTGSDEADWFAELARPLLGKDAGLALHCLTGFPQSSCYNYTATPSRRKPPGWLIVTILRSPQGRQWLAAFMDGCVEDWWLEYQRAERVKEFHDRQKAEAKRLGLE